MRWSRNYSRPLGNPLTMCCTEQMLANCHFAWTRLDLSKCDPMGLPLADWAAIIGVFITAFGVMRYAITPVLRKIGWLGPKRIRSFRNFKSHVRRLAKENRRLFLTFGPRSSVSSMEPEKFDNSTWQAARLELASNNAKILELFRQHRQLIPTRHIPAFEAWEAHIIAFKAHIEDPAFDYRHHQYPREIDHILGI